MLTDVRKMDGAEAGTLPMSPLAELIAEQSARRGGHAYLEAADSDRLVSYDALEEDVQELRGQLAAAGCPPGATVALATGDPIEFTVAFLAVMASGRWAAPLDPGVLALDHGALERAMSRVQAAYVVTDRPELAGGRVHSRAHRYGTALVVGAPDAPRPLRLGGGAVLSSSGTTGTPKLIPLPQAQMLHAARNVATHHQFSTDDRGFNPLPLFHINAEVVGLLATLIAGACLVLDDRFHRTGFWEKMEQRHVTWINAVPAIISRLAEPRPGEHIPSGIRFIRSASAPLAPESMKRFELNTGIPVLETYGMTEAASQITANPLTGTRKPGSVGLPVGVELRIVPEGGPGETRSPDQLREGEAGEVEIRGPSVIMACHGEQGVTRLETDGWLKTGDIGHLDGDGYLYLDGRRDDVINRGGEKVFPREIEETILKDPSVAAVSVVGQFDPELGEVPVAFLVLHGVGDESDRGLARDVVGRIRRNLDAELVRTKRPAALHVVLQLPLGVTGKVQRRALKEHDMLVIYYVGSSAETA
jgi:acyl-CoA synthetase (AMP-forming)/AMP-acid ligase II